MPLVPAKCTNCGAPLLVDDALDAAICPYCNTAYIVEKAVNNYNITNNITAGVVNIYGDVKSDFVIESGVLKEYTGASTDVVIPDTVKVISKDAFCGNKYLTSLQIPDSVIEIESFAFAGCQNLTDIKLSNKLSVINAGTFSNCTKLKEITIPSSVTNFIANNPNDDYWFNIYDVFKNCTSLRTITGAERYDLESFEGSLWYKEHKHLISERKRQRRCWHCGGEFISKGLFTKVCSKCGKPKDYM